MSTTPSEDDDLDLDYVPRPLNPAGSSINTTATATAPIEASTDESDDSLNNTASRHTPPSFTNTTQEAEENETSLKETVRTAKHQSGTGERILMTEDEDDDAYEEFKRKKDEGGKQRGRKKRKVGSSWRETGGKKRVKSEGGDKKPPNQRLWKTASDSSDQDVGVDVGVEMGLPAYLKARKDAVEAAKAAIEDTDTPPDALRFPPDYGDVYFSDDERLGELASKPNFKNIPPCAPYKDIPLEDSLGIIPCSIAQYLRNYQVEGVAFLHKNFVFQEGCILGDDMGLGKTVQVIAFLTAAFGKTGDERDRKRMRKIRRGGGGKRWFPKVIVVCPGSLISNWQREFDVWGWWNVYVYHGSKERKESALEAARAGRCEVLITTYGTYKKACGDINMVEWDCVIADECHQIKDRRTEVTKAMNEINALCRIGLTGTAIQNNYEELWTLLNWCRPGGIGTLTEWNRAIATPLKVGQSHDATLRQIGNARKIAKRLVNNLLGKMFLRRLKTLIAHQLPKKSDKVVFCSLTEVQRKAYQGFLESEMVQNIKYSGQVCDCGKLNKNGEPAKRGSCCYVTDSKGRKWREMVFPCIQQIQKLSNHLANWIPQNEDNQETREKKRELLETCLPDDYERIINREMLTNFMDPEMCGKWIVLQKLLRFWHQNDDKVLIFSYSLQLLRILHKLFQSTEYNVCYFDGSMSLDERTNVVSEFNSDPSRFVFLISTRAGGVGLNITAANKVVIFDPNWNPSYDLQAQDRAYRIGQTRDVEVFRLILAGTIEEIVYARQIYKQQQANIGYGASEERRYFSGVQGDKTNQGELFGLRNLFTFQDNTILKEIVNKTNVAESRAGVQVAGMEANNEEADVELDDDYEGENAISQLAAIAKGEQAIKKKKAHNPVAAILAEAGISYTHENSEVIGTSKIEARISKRAVETTNDAGGGDLVAFASGSTIYKFHPPMHVMKRQFCTMAKMFRFDDVREFALVVEGWTQKQRRDALDKFYKMRRDSIVRGEGGVGLEDFPDEKRVDVKTEDKVVDKEIKVEEGDDEEGDEL
ncbi:P-loop containing nucleoside triphosphate hydrolase protein [Tuber borchii]|uniref:P-loop containing nucleoside triphosphate hydrolase protein n=1 Tax=Tuber borchii TaxID=42251 RepID=A0A2T7A2P8_TUBBO|nr:P-loop containing nucleoside triphosphate hydrolase protein [Tuber borchii]